jgi:hypothetical protein
MWFQYDRFVPHSDGGENTLENLVITGAGGNFGKMEYTIEEPYLLDPISFTPIQSILDGL